MNWLYLNIYNLKNEIVVNMMLVFFQLLYSNKL
jgi:hypothetical protein